MNSPTQISEKPMEKKKNGIIGNIIFVLCMGILAAAVLYGIKNSSDPDGAFIFGYKPQMIKSDSMAPNLYVNSMILVKKVPYQEVHSGDIITFKLDDGKYICHRVQEVTNRGFLTKGDNNRTTDNLVIDESHFIGKVIGSTNFFAELFAFMEQPTFAGAFKFVFLPLAVIVVIVTVSILAGGKRSEHKRNKIKSQVSA